VSTSDAVPFDVQKHVEEIEHWIAEAAFDQGIDGDEVAFDIVSAYIVTEFTGGEDSHEAKAVRRAIFGSEAY
jgi:hypothetical protein